LFSELKAALFVLRPLRIEQLSTGDTRLPLFNYLLSRICRELSGHWMDKYGHPILVIETFVQRDRYRGTCYRAAGWTHVGATAGRSRNDVDQTLSVPVKEIFIRTRCA
jgi:hypothetical protein